LWRLAQPESSGKPALLTKHGLQSVLLVVVVYRRFSATTTKEKIIVGVEKAVGFCCESHKV
jgi:hypothetical protein